MEGSMDTVDINAIQEAQRRRAGQQPSNVGMPGSSNGALAATQPPAPGNTADPFDERQLILKTLISRLKDNPVPGGTPQQPGGMML